jgi:hypothetical protein
MTTNLEKGLIEISAVIGIVTPVVVIEYPIETGIDERAKPSNNLFVSSFTSQAYWHT